VFAIGIIWFSDSVAVSWSILCDDAKGPEFAAALESVSGSAFTAK
jgi:hypothetical protein